MILFIVIIIFNIPVQSQEENINLNNNESLKAYKNIKFSDTKNDVSQKISNWNVKFSCFDKNNKKVKLENFNPKKDHLMIPIRDLNKELEHSDYFSLQCYFFNDNLYRLNFISAAYDKKIEAKVDHYDLLYKIFKYKYSKPDKTIDFQLGNNVNSKEYNKSIWIINNSKRIALYINKFTTGNIEKYFVNVTIDSLPILEKKDRYEHKRLFSDF